MLQLASWAVVLDHTAIIPYFLQIASESDRLLTIYQIERREAKKRLIREKQRAKDQSALVQSIPPASPEENNTPHNENTERCNELAPIISDIASALANSVVMDDTPNASPVLKKGPAEVSVNSPLVAGAIKAPAIKEGPTGHHSADLVALIVEHANVKSLMQNCLKLLFEKSIQSDLALERSRIRLQSKGMHQREASGKKGAVGAAGDTKSDDLVKCLETVSALLGRFAGT